MLTDLPVDASPRGWRLAGSPGRLSRRAVDFLDRDSDALEEADELARDPDDEPGGAGRRLLVRALGPWSLAARLEMPGGPSVLTDRGARRDAGRGGGRPGCPALGAYAEPGPGASRRARALACPRGHRGHAEPPRPGGRGARGPALPVPLPVRRRPPCGGRRRGPGPRPRR